MSLRDRIIKEYELVNESYSRNQIIYDIRNGIVEKLKRRNSYRLTSYVVKVALAFTRMRKRIYGSLHYSLFHNQPYSEMQTGSKLERLY